MQTKGKKTKIKEAQSKTLYNMTYSTVTPFANKHTQLRRNKIWNFGKSQEYKVEYLKEALVTTAKDVILKKKW